MDIKTILMTWPQECWPLEWDLRRCWEAVKRIENETGRESYATMAARGNAGLTESVEDD